MQRVGNLKEKFLSFENLYFAYKKAYKGTRNYYTCEFTFYLEKEILTLQKDLADKVYEPGNYAYFKITEPKEREISVAPFRDRVVHHALVNILEPIYEKRFIYDSYATRKEKGTHKAVERAQFFIRKKYRFLKMDIQKYFDSINHEILKSIIGRKIKDPFILSLCDKIISKGGNGVKGLPIGNLTSQFFANVYLDIFDHFIKEELRIKHYLRYMDDFCIFTDDKNELNDLRGKITGFLKEKLMLDVKDRATVINNRIHGLSFLGVRIFPGLIRHIRDNFYRSFKKLKKKEWQYEKGMISYNIYACSMQSLTSHLNYYGNNLLKNRLYRGAVSKAVPTG